MYLYGASGHAKVIADILAASGESIGGLVDDNMDVNELHGYRVYHSYEGLSPFIVSIGSNAIRKKVVEKLSCEFAKAIHPSAIVSSSASVEEGTVVMQGAILQADVKVGKHCIINTGASIDHECIIEDYAHISPHATLCGNVKVGEGAWVGAGVTIIPGVTIGRWCVIGAGAVVIRDILEGTVVAGVPAKIVKNKNGGGKYLIPSRLCRRFVCDDKMVA